MAKDHRCGTRNTALTVPESLRARRSEAESRWRRWHENARPLDHERLHLAAALDEPYFSGPDPVTGPGLPALGLDDTAERRLALKELHARMMSEALGGEGLVAVARLASAAAAAPVAVIVPDLITTVMPFGVLDTVDVADLEYWVRERLHGRDSPTPEDLAAEVPLQIGDEMLGMVALLDVGGDLDPAALWALDVAAAVALTVVAVENARIDAEHRLRGSFLEQLRSGAELSSAEILRRARRLGCDLGDGAVMLCVEVEGGRPRMVASAVAGDYPGAFAEPLEVASAEDRATHQVWALLPALAGEPDPVATTEAAAERLANRLRQYGPVGLSRFHRDPKEFRRAIDETELMLDVMRRAVVPSGDEIVDGTYKLLFRLLASHPDELERYHETTIAPLVRHDEQYRTDLVRTLEAYLETNCNMNVTAETIFAHRHTVAHRLERIQELTGLDASVHEDRERLGLGLKIHRLMA